MNVIHKQIVNIGTINLIMPLGYEIIRFAPDPKGNLCIWYIFNTYNEKLINHKVFHILGTGHKYDSTWKYVGSCNQDRYVWHLMEVVV